MTQEEERLNRDSDVRSCVDDLLDAIEASKSSECLLVDVKDIMNHQRQVSTNNRSSTPDDMINVQQDPDDELQAAPGPSCSAQPSPAAEGPINVEDESFGDPDQLLPTAGAEEEEGDFDSNNKVTGRQRKQETTTTSLENPAEEEKEEDEEEDDFHSLSPSPEPKINSSVGNTPIDQIKEPPVDIVDIDPTDPESSTADQVVDIPPGAVNPSNSVTANKSSTEEKEAFSNTEVFIEEDKTEETLQEHRKPLSTVETAVPSNDADQPLFGAATEASVLPPTAESSSTEAENSQQAPPAAVSSQEAHRTTAEKVETTAAEQPVHPTADDQETPKSAKSTRAAAIAARKAKFSKFRKPAAAQQSDDVEIFIAESKKKPPEPESKKEEGSATDVQLNHQQAPYLAPEISESDLKLNNTDINCNSDKMDDANANPEMESKTVVIEQNASTAIVNPVKAAAVKPPQPVTDENTALNSDVENNDVIENNGLAATTANGLPDGNQSLNLDQLDMKNPPAAAATTNGSNGGGSPAPAPPNSNSNAPSNNNNNNNNKPASSTPSSNNKKPSPPKQADKKKPSSADAADPFDAVVIKGGDDLDVVASRLKLQFQTILQSKEREFSEKLNKYQQKYMKLSDELITSKRDKETAQQNVSEMKVLVSEYETTMANMMKDMSTIKQSGAGGVEDIGIIIRDRDQALDDICAIESSLSELHRRYDRARTSLDQQKKHEEEILKDNKSMREQLKLAEERQALLLQHTKLEIEKASQEIKRLQKANETETLALRANLKKRELQIASLEQNLGTKVKEMEELTKICDDLIAKAGEPADEH